MRAARSWVAGPGREALGLCRAAGGVTKKGRNRMKAETILAELNRLRKDLDEDPSDLEWVALHHAFCFISYKAGEFQEYLDGEASRGAFDELG